MRNRLLIIFTFISFCSYGQMRRIYLDGSGMNNQLRKISMVNAAEGYFAFTLGAGFSGDSGRSITIRSVTNGNVDYNGFNVNLTGGFQTSGVQAFSRDTCLLYGNFGQNPAILYSNNMGGSYQLIYQSQGNMSQLTYGIEDMIFPQHTNTGFAVEADRIIKTTNRGLTWSAVYVSTGSFFQHIEAIDDNRLFAFNTDGSSNKMVMTSDGGAHWKNVNLPTKQKINYASFISSTKGWLSATENQSLYYTSDGGTTWVLKNQTDIMPFFCTKMKFLDDSTGYATADQYAVLKTTDSGRTWESLPRDNTYSYLNNTHNELVFLNRNQFWAGGGQGFIEMTTNGGGLTLPKAIFTTDTTGVSATGIVHVTNLGKNGYQYSWYKNNVLFSRLYSSSYSHGTYDQFDTVKLVVTKGAYMDSAETVLFFNAPPKPTPPSFNYFTPDSGSTGTIVNIIGNNFGNATAILFGDTAASSFTIVNDTLIKAVVAGGASGKISIVTPVGTVTKDGFKYFVPLKITGFTPLSGPVGTIITINGDQFSPTPANNIVSIGGIRVPVLSATSKQITVRAPAGTFYQEITVTVNGLTVASNIPFIVSNPGVAPLTKNSFPSRVIFPYNPSDVHIAQGDLDGDGKIDLVLGVCAGYNWFSIMKNNCTKDTISFTQVPTSARPVGMGRDGRATIADLDGDGRPDIIGGDDINVDGAPLCVYRNLSFPGTIQFAPVQIIAGGGPSQLSVCDLDGDGKPEIFGSDHSGGFWIYQNISHDTTILFSHWMGPNIPSSAGLTLYNDLDGDGKMDILVSEGAGIDIYRNLSNKGALNFERYPVISSLPTQIILWGAFKLADIDGDGKADVVVRTNDTTVTVALNKSTPGNMSFGSPFQVTAPGWARGIGIGDLDGDGKLDLAASSNKGMIYKNSLQKNNAGFESGIDLTSDTIKDIAIDIEPVDVDGDGKTDLVTMNSGPGYATTLSVYKNQSPGSVAICQNSDTSLSSNLTGSSYKWQVKFDSTFINVTDGTHFIGSGTSVLMMKNMDTTFNQAMFRCLVDGNPGSLTMLSVNSLSTPAISIFSSDSNFCKGSTGHFTGTGINTGLNPIYQWQVNGQNKGTNSLSFETDSLNDHDTVRLVMIPNLMCKVTDSVISNFLIVHVGAKQTSSVIIQSSDSVICAGSSVRFYATAINPGMNPFYQWQIDGINAGPDSTVFETSQLINGSKVSLILKPDIACSTLSQVNSNTVHLVVNPLFTPSVHIDQITAGGICEASSVSFSASSPNANGQSVFQWFKNGNYVGSDSALYVDPSAQNNDSIYVIFYPHANCSLTDSAVSNTLAIIINPVQIPAINISGNTSIDSGSNANIISGLSNAGNGANYQWQDSTGNHEWQDIAGENNSGIQYKPVNSGNKLRCLFSSADLCNNTSNVISNEISFNLHTPPDTTLATPVDSSSAIKSYPNPVHSTLTVSGLKQTDQWQSLYITDIYGKKLLKINVSGITTLSIPVQSLPNGVYIIVINGNGSKSTTLRFLKE